MGKYNIRSNQTEKESFGNISRGLNWYGRDEGLVPGVRSVAKHRQGHRPVRKCEGCQEIANNPSRAPLHRWEYHALPWQRLHIDFAGQVQGKMLFFKTKLLHNFTYIYREKRREDKKRKKRKKEEKSYKRNLYRLNFVMLSLCTEFPVAY